jgi:hypothetical protein
MSSKASPSLHSTSALHGCSTAYITTPGSVPRQRRDASFHSTNRYLLSFPLLLQLPALALAARLDPLFSTCTSSFKSLFPRQIFRPAPPTETLFPESCLYIRSFRLVSLFFIRQNKTLRADLLRPRQHRRTTLDFSSRSIHIVPLQEIFTSARRLLGLHLQKQFG